MMRAPFQLQRDGTISARLPAGGADAIAEIANEIASRLSSAPESSLGTPESDMFRFFPPAYDDDAEQEEEFRHMTRDDLVAHKAAAARAVLASVDAGGVRRGVWSAHLDDATARAWLGLLNDARLMLGTRIGVTEEMDHTPRDGTDEATRAHNLYLYLSALEEYLVDTLSGGLAE